MNVIKGIQKESMKRGARHHPRAITSKVILPAVIISVFMVTPVWAAEGQQSAAISKAQVQAVLDSIDKASLNKDAAGVIANYASNAVITATTVQGGQSYTSKRDRDDYLRMLESSLKNAVDYSLQRRDVTIEMAPDGKTAQCMFTLVEKWRGDKGRMEEAVSKESLSLVLLGGKLLVTKDHCDAVVTPAGVPDVKPAAANAGKADFSTPMAAAKSYFAAMKAGDATALGSACLGSSEQKEWTVQLARLCLASGKLEEAATAKFGREETGKAFSDDLKRTASLITEALAALPNCDLRIDGTNATITPRPDQAGPTPEHLEPLLKLQKVAGHWKVLLDIDLAKQDFNADLLEASAASMEKCAADIGAGLFKTAAEAQQAQMSAMTTQYMQKQKGPAGRPAEKPVNK